MSRPIAPLRDFIHREFSSGVVILVAAALGLLIANTPFSKGYFSLLDMKISLGSENIYLKLTLLKFINYLLMTLFFFVVGLEIKREMSSGHLSTFKKAIMPFVAALGGMALPAGIYLMIAGDEAPSGWGVPVATDIALAVGVLTMLGSSVPAALRSFLLAIAVIDDIGAILVIAFVYSTGVQYSWIIAAIATALFILLLQRVRVVSIFIYVLVGVLLWYSLYRSGVHPTLAGVFLGLLTPNISKPTKDLVDIEDNNLSLIEWLEHKLHPATSFVIVPLFAFANTGVVISSQTISNALNSKIAWGVFFGLVVGKPIGILFATLVASKAKIGELPDGTKLPSILATGSAAGIGFTVSIFIANLAFDSRQNQEIAILAVIVASVVSAIVSIFIFKVLAKSK